MTEVSGKNDLRAIVARDSSVHQEGEEDEVGRGVKINAAESDEQWHDDDDQLHG